MKLEDFFLLNQRRLTPPAKKSPWCTLDWKAVTKPKKLPERRKTNMEKEEEDNQNENQIPDLDIRT